MTHNFQITDKTVYTKTVWTFETEEGDDITVTCEEQDIYDEWYIYSAVEGQIHTESDLGRLLIEACCEDLNDQYNDDEPEYDSAGFTEEDRIVDGQYMNNTKDEPIPMTTPENQTAEKSLLRQVWDNINSSYIIK